MRGLVLIATAVWFALAERAVGQDGQADARELLRAVTDLSADDFGRRERATQALWESGDEALIADVVQHGATTEARVRAAQVLSSYRWGIVPGVTGPVREQLERFRNGDTPVRMGALAALMQLGELRAAARCFLLVQDPVERHQLNGLMRARMGTAVPRELVRGRSDEVGAFLDMMAAVGGDYQRDRDAFQRSERSDAGIADDWIAGVVARIGQAVPNDEPAAAGRAGLLTRGAVATVLASLDRASSDEALAAFDILQSQGAVAEAIEVLRNAVDAGAEAPPAEVLRTYLAREVAQVKVQLYSKKALDLPKSVAYQPTGLALTDGFRDVVAFCHACGLTEIVQEAGVALMARLQEASPAALPVFSAWAASYPELRELAGTAARAAHHAGVPPEFAYGPLADAWSQRGRWFGQFVTMRERTSQLEAGTRNGGWSVLAAIDPAVLPAAVRAQVAMSAGDWKAAASASAEAAEHADTLAFGAVQAFLASIAYGRAGDPDTAAKWRTLAERVPMGNGQARAALANAMQRFGDDAGARRNRMLLLQLHPWRESLAAAATPECMQALRLVIATADLSNDATARALAPILLAQARTMHAGASPDSLSGFGEILRDRVSILQCELAEALAAQDWVRAEVALRAVHQCHPGDVRPYAMLARHSGSFPASFRAAVRNLLAETTRHWERAVVLLPDNARCARELQRCRVMAETL